MKTTNKVHLAITFEKDGIYVETRGGADNMTQKKAIPRTGETDMKQELVNTIMAYDPPQEKAPEKAEAAPAPDDASAARTAKA